MLHYIFNQVFCYSHALNQQMHFASYTLSPQKFTIHRYILKFHGFWATLCLSWTENHVHCYKNIYYVRSDGMEKIWIKSLKCRQYITHANFVSIVPRILLLILIKSVFVFARPFSAHIWWLLKGFCEDLISQKSQENCQFDWA